MSGLACAFLSGFAVLVLEVAGARVLGPWFGSGLYAWAAAVSTTLGALAAGCGAGGLAADRWGERPLGGVLAAAGGACALLPAAAWPVLDAAGRLGPRLGALAASAALLGPPLVLLGAVGPLVVKGLARSPKRIGAGVGAAFSVSTVGSLAGALASGFWLVPNVPLPWIFAGAGAALAAAGGLLLSKRARPAAAAALLPLLLARGGLFPADATVRERRQGLMGEAAVHEAGGRRWLTLDRRIQSVVGLDGAFPHERLFELLPLSRPAGRSLLMLGLGGGSTVAMLEERHGLRVACVELDPGVAELARRWFRARCEGGLSVLDGRAAVRAGPVGGFDFIVVDAYGPEGLPPHLATVEFFREARRALAPGGVLAANVVGYAGGPHAVVWKSVHRSLGEVFPAVRAFAPEAKEGRQTNIVLFASEGPLAGAAWASELAREPAEGRLLTDALNPLDALNAPVAARYGPGTGL